DIPERFYPKGGHPRESWRSLFYANLIKDFVGEIEAGGDRNQGNFEDGAWVQEGVNAVELSFPQRRWGDLPLAHVSETQGLNRRRRASPHGWTSSSTRTTGADQSTRRSLASRPSTTSSRISPMRASPGPSPMPLPSSNASSRYRTSASVRRISWIASWR